MIVKVRTWRSTLSKRISTICLMFAMFFNPFGFDALFKMTMDLTGSYWITDAIFYGIAAVFFGLYIYFNKKSKK
jgi:vacuolar-type H+-ATPase subunit I/STV1